MSQSARKLAGAFLLPISIVLWSTLAVAIFLGLLAEAPMWVLLIFFAAAGLGWIFPAMWIVRWMARPDTALSSPRAGRGS